MCRAFSYFLGEHGPWRLNWEFHGFLLKNWEFLAKDSVETAGFLCII